MLKRMRGKRLVNAGAHEAAATTDSQKGHMSTALLPSLLHGQAGLYTRYVEPHTP